MKIVVLGGGESGYGSAVLAKIKGYEVFLTDLGSIAPKYASILDSYNIEYEQGKHSEERIIDADIAVKSPGIPDTAPIVCKLREKSIPVISEIEFAGKHTNGRVIGITGSNGKTTTTTLIGEILKAAGYDVAVGGNIGESFAYTVATDDKKWHVLELSSFQLDGIESFRPDITVITNITPDHLDRYEYKFQNYIDSKMRILCNQRPKDYFIGCIDNSVLCREVILRNPDVKRLPFSAYIYDAESEYKGGAEDDTVKIKHYDPEVSIYAGNNSALNDIHRHDYPGAFLLSDGNFRATVDGRTVIVNTNKMHIKGIHNIYNAMAAALAALAAGVDAEVIEQSIYDFAGVEHRMESVGIIKGVRYINDSKATNVDSTWYALDSMTGPTIWIAGGTDKGNNYQPIKDLVSKHVKALVCMGMDNSKLTHEFSSVAPAIYETRSMEEAMSICAKLAEEGDTVLLSPACASFDLFKNYEDRGKQFKQCVAKIKSTDQN